MRGDRSYRFRQWFARTLWRVVVWADPYVARNLAERDRAIGRLGEYAYGSAAWTSVGAMIDHALLKAANEGRKGVVPHLRDRG